MGENILIRSDIVINITQTIENGVSVVLSELLRWKEMLKFHFFDTQQRPI